jgi:FkbM family methyltransferase
MSILRVLLWPLRRRQAVAAPSQDGMPPLTPEQYEALQPIVTIPDGTIEVAYCTPNPATRWRVDTFFTKEPDTLQWIRGFASGEVLVDIGANVGMYTIWAAKTRGARVFAFEPESQNYALLQKNIVINGLGALVTAYCAALTDEEAFSVLYLSDFMLGGSCHTFGAAQDHHLQQRTAGYTQGCYSTTLDRLVDRGTLPVPDHIKVDVDGLEHKVFAGCRRTLADPKVKSVLVEINTGLAEHRRIIDDMARLGFGYSTEQVASSLRQQGPFKGVGNYVFRR